MLRSSKSSQWTGTVSCWPARRPAEGLPLPFDLVHRGKGSLAVDLKSAAGRRIVRDLAPQRMCWWRTSASGPWPSSGWLTTISGPNARTWLTARSRVFWPVRADARRQGRRPDRPSLRRPAHRDRQQTASWRRPGSRGRSRQRDVGCLRRPGGAAPVRAGAAALTSTSHWPTRSPPGRSGRSPTLSAPETPPARWARHIGWPRPIRPFRCSDGHLW